MGSLFLGIDTSNYTTSVALISADGIVTDQRRVLAVRKGNRGLRQSEAVFQHVNNLPELLEKLPSGWGNQVCAIGVSRQPRPVEGSYMPVFRVGVSSARGIASALGVPLVPTTHQEGHLAAGLFAAKRLDGTDFCAGGDPFLAIHLSGGTTELLKVVPGDTGWQVELLGGTSDLHAGQFIDRVGTRLGLSFPAGPHLEQLAEDTDIKLPVAVRGPRISFSGPEAAAQRMIDDGVNPAHVARAVEKCVAYSLTRAILNLAGETGLRKVLVFGGVAANVYIRREMARRVEAEGIELGLAAAELSSDNAVGAALLAKWTSSGEYIRSGH